MLDEVQPRIPPPQQNRELAWHSQAREIRRALEKLPSFDKYRDQIQMAHTPEGLRINLLESNETPLFKVGSTELNDEAVALLQVIAQEVQSFDNPIVIEGHTDSRPFGTDSKMTNWDLSTGRAHTARRVLEKAGIQAQRLLEVRGFADRQLLNPANPEDSRNRRISITLLSEEALAERAKVPDETLIPWLER